MQALILVLPADPSLNTTLCKWAEDEKGNVVPKTAFSLLHTLIKIVQGLATLGWLAKHGRTKYFYIEYIFRVYSTHTVKY